MKVDDIKRLIVGNEHKQLELKKTTGELKDAMHSACAFLNTSGGWLIFGITPTSLKVIGQEVTDNTQREIANALGDIEPAIDVTVEYVDVPEHPGNKVIALHLDSWVWGKEPYTYKGCPYYRVESTTQQMPREMFVERLNAAKPKNNAWERQNADGISISDLYEERIRGSVRLGVERGRMAPSALTEPLETILAKMNLLTDDNKPNNAAAMLFSTNTRSYTQFRLRLARFRGNDKNAFLDNMRAEGNFFDLLDAGMSFLFKWLPQSDEIKGFTREEHLEIPAEALREALVNCLCHRQMEKYNLTPGIAIYDDRVEISNPGSLPPQLTPETIKLPHLSYPYNPIIAEMLYKTTFLENWGSGAGRIIDACRKAGVAEPTWKSEGGFVIVTFPRPNGTQDGTQDGTQGGTQDDTQGDTQGDAQDVNLDIWIESQLILRPKITTEELALLSGKGLRTIKRHIAKMPHIKYEGSGY
ncbi:MAG: putative DNA binding domain-containing protein, partial [Clostridia bacterium]|nr:putative DNA binding domain-containing protein [Clostridia bacterium]